VNVNDLRCNKLVLPNAHEGQRQSLGLEASDYLAGIAKSAR
jgi:hypothetical protein